MARYSRSPGLFGALFGITWTLICLVLIGAMMKAYGEMWGMPGILFGIFLPLSMPTFPFLAWYMTGGFPWLWTLGFLAAVVMGKMILTEPGA